MSTELALVPPKETALQVFQAENGLDPYLQQIRAEIDAFVPDVSTKKGRDAIASIAHKVARSKTALDNVGKELVAELKEIPKKIDAERKRMRDTLDAWKDEVRAPLNEWEQAEADRVAYHQMRIDHMRGYDTEGRTAAEIASAITLLEECEVGPEWEEFEAEAHRVKAATLTALQLALTKRKAYEAEQAELERLRAEAAQREQKEREERIAREAAEQAQREAEQRAQAERDAAAKREADAKAAAERRELERAERAAAAERQRQADEQARQEAESKAREADIAHKTAILTSIKEAFMGAGVTEEQAKAIINMIRKGEVPSVSINY
jgi:hypothetical protein